MLHPTPQNGQIVLTSLAGFIDSLGTKAPTGHATTHSPQETQLESTSGLSPNVVILVSYPLKPKSIALTPKSSLHVLTQIPQSTHFLRSRSKKGFELSMEILLI